MVVSRACKGTTGEGGVCGANALREGEYCFWHDPDHAKDATEARRLGGLRRRKEKAVEGAYEFGGLVEVSQVRRLLEIAALDTLSLENSVARSRTLAYLAQVALKALEVGAFEERLRALEGAAGQGQSASRGRRR